MPWAMRVLTTIAVFSLGFTVGCEPAPTKAILNGKMTYKNDVVKGGTVKLFNAKNELVGSALLTPEGTFVATDLPKEELKLTVETENEMSKMNTAVPVGTTPIPTPGVGTVPVPAKYHKPDTTPLKVNGASLKAEVTEFKLED